MVTPGEEETSTVNTNQKQESQSKLIEAVTLDRTRYIGWLKGFRQSTGESDSNSRRDLTHN